MNQASRAAAPTPVAGFFGAAGQELFGCLHGVEPGDASGVGVVLCQTLGVESLSAHRSFRILAEALAADGVPTLRFDYRGTGDATGAGSGELRLASCVEDVGAAIRCLRSAAGVDRVVLVGVRLGALFAFKAAELEEVSGLVLWGPVVAGRRFVRDWKRLARSSEFYDEKAADGSVPAAGFSLTESFLDELHRESLLGAAPLGPPPCLVVERDELPPEDELVARLGELGAEVERRRPPGFLGAVIAEPHLTEVPDVALREIGTWIRETSFPHLSRRVEADGSIRPAVVAVAEERGASIRIREQVLDREVSRDVFGLVSEPEDPAALNGHAVVLLNSGSVHHIGPSRMYVELARRMAAAGARVCRADLSGIGESPARPGSRDNDPYPAGAVDDVAAVLATITADGRCSRVALVGLCSGAWASFHSALQLAGITDIVLLNPDFYGERSVFGVQARAPRLKDFSHYKHSARSWGKWKKLLSGRANLPKIARVLWNQLWLSLSLWRDRLRGERHQLEEDLTRLGQKGVRVGVVSSPGDGGQDFLRAHGGRVVAKLERTGLLRQVTVADTDHPFSPPASRVRLCEILSEWLLPTTSPHDPSQLAGRSRGAETSRLGAATGSRLLD